MTSANASIQAASAYQHAATTFPLDRYSNRNMLTTADTPAVPESFNVQPHGGVSAHNLDLTPMRFLLYTAMYAAIAATIVSFIGSN